jgi:rod shape-determining protein MreC
VIGQPPSSFEQWITIHAGKRHGVRDNSAVVTSEGYLIGKVTQVTPSTSRVTLLTDESSGASARVLRRKARGLIRDGQGAGDTLVLDLVPREMRLARGDRVVTAGYRLGPRTGLYPKGIPIGVVSSIGRTDLDVYQRIQVEPHADFSSLDAVVVLVRKRGR